MTRQEQAEKRVSNRRKLIAHLTKEGDLVTRCRRKGERRKSMYGHFDRQQPLYAWAELEHWEMVKKIALIMGV